MTHNHQNFNQTHSLEAEPVENWHLRKEQIQEVKANFENIWFSTWDTIHIYIHKTRVSFCRKKQQPEKNKHILKIKNMINKL